MSFFSKGIPLEQNKEPMLTRNLLVMKHEPEFFVCDYSDTAPEKLTPKQIIEIARKAEIIDESDGKPLADKLERAGIFGTDTLIVDAIDDEPYISSQMGVALHNTEKLALAVKLAAKAANASESYIAMYKHIFEVNINIPRSIGGIKVERIGGLYPAENRAYRHIPKGKNHLVVGSCSLVHLARAVLENRKMTTCFVTVAGDAIANPRNVEAPIGITANKVIETCSLAEEPEVIVIGGSMTGKSIFEPRDEVISPTSRAVLCFARSNDSYSYVCIGCGRCDHACPEKLSVSSIRLMTEFGRVEDLMRLDTDFCTGCGACSYVCPSRLDLSGIVLKAKKTVLMKKEGAKNG